MIKLFNSGNSNHCYNLMVLWVIASFSWFTRGGAYVTCLYLKAAVSGSRGVRYHDLYGQEAK